MKKTFGQLIKKFLAYGAFIFFAFPASTNYSIKSYEFGGGGGSLDSANYALNAILGQVSSSMSSTLYNVRSGLIFAQMANVPPAPTLTNSSNWYNKLLLIIAIGNNPSDTKFAVAITEDNWVTTKWVQNDNTVGVALGIEDYQTYANWGSGAGENIVGLSANTTYRVRVKALQGEFSGTDLGPQASAATSAITLSFDIDVATTDTNSDPPYNVDFGSLTTGSVSTATNKVWIDLSTNAEYGGFVYVYGTNNGLKSTNTNYTITSATANLASAGEGYGLQASNVSGLTTISPYNGSSENVGLVDTTIREILNSASAPVTNGRAQVSLKARTTSTTPASNDYSDTLTVIAASTF